MITRCDMCLGKKTIVGLGMLVKDCPRCDGIGHVKVIENKGNIPVDKIKSAAQSVSRGRPKKVNLETT